MEILKAIAKDLEERGYTVNVCEDSGSPRFLVYFPDYTGEIFDYGFWLVDGDLELRNPWNQSAGKLCLGDPNLMEQIIQYLGPPQ